MAEPPTLPHTFRHDRDVWAAFVARCQERGLTPATKVAELVTAWTLAESLGDDAHWTP